VSSCAAFPRQSGVARLAEGYARAPVSFLDLRQQWQIDDARAAGLRAWA